MLKEVIKANVEWVENLHELLYQFRNIIQTIDYVGWGVISWFCVTKICEAASFCEYTIQKHRQGDIRYPKGKYEEYMAYFVSEKKRKICAISCMELIPTILQLILIWNYYSNQNNEIKIAFTIIVLVCEFIIMVLTHFVWKHNADQGKYWAERSKR